METACVTVASIGVWSKRKEWNVRSNLQSSKAAPTRYLSKNTSKNNFPDSSFLKVGSSQKCVSTISANLSSWLSSSIPPSAARFIFRYIPRLYFSHFSFRSSRVSTLLIKPSSGSTDTSAWLLITSILSTSSSAASMFPGLIFTKLSPVSTLNQYLLPLWLGVNISSR